MKNNFFFYCIYFVLTLTLFEFSLRAFYSIKHKNTNILVYPQSLIKKYYPESFNHIYRNNEQNDDSINILFLGGSAINKDWSHIEKILKDTLSQKYPFEFNITNCAVPAHTSLDSRIKFDLLKNQNFDIILLYHGINELRFNNCPDTIFDKDYRHVEFYANTKGLTGKMSNYTILPHVINSIKLRIKQSFGFNQWLSIGAPRHKKWIKHGDSIKTKSSFYQNYKYIINNSKQRGIDVIIPTFAFYVPQNYSIEKFKNKDLDYCNYKSPIEMWGAKENVIKGIKTHNKLICDNFKFKYAHIIDMDSLIGKNKKNFDDICHFTKDGSKEFVSIIIKTFEKIIENNL